MNKNLKLIIIVSLLIMIALGIGVTVAYFDVIANDTNTITGYTVSPDLHLTVTKLSIDVKEDLIPQADSSIIQAVIGTNNKMCIDGNDNSVCQVYQVTLKNIGNYTINVNGTIKLTANNNVNLKWAEISGTSSPSLIKSINGYEKNIFVLN